MSSFIKSIYKSNAIVIYFDIRIGRLNKNKKKLYFLSEKKSRENDWSTQNVANDLLPTPAAYYRIYFYINAL